MSVELKIIDSGATGLVQRLAKLTQSVTTGVHEDADPYPDGTSVATVAAVHEFGSEDVPQRSFLRGWLDSGGTTETGKVGQEQVGKVADGAAPDTVGAEIGKLQVAGIVKRINAGIFPALAPTTLADPDRNPDPTPLVDTTRLRDSITFEVMD